MRLDRRERSRDLIVLVMAQHKIPATYPARHRSPYLMLAKNEFFSRRTSSTFDQKT
jgi:hypothetical protein